MIGTVRVLYLLELVGWQVKFCIEDRPHKKMHTPTHGRILLQTMSSHFTFRMNFVSYTMSFCDG